ncbi:hypothetical protein WAI453_003011 [Rhynchosporium graminicola]
MTRKQSEQELFFQSITPLPPNSLSLLFQKKLAGSFGQYQDVALSESCFATSKVCRNVGLAEIVSRVPVQQFYPGGIGH